MSFTIRNLILLIAGFPGIIFPALSQDTPVNRGFYYWKNTTYYLSEDEENLLTSVSAEKLYVKFFEVAKDELFGAVPEAKTELNMYDYSYLEDPKKRDVMVNLQVIPTVFVRNDALKGKTATELDTLADNIVFLVNKYFDERFESIVGGLQEIQIDCDWTPTTKDNYFHLLKSIKRISGKTLSCTLRLYPYKYSDKMGVPPVDKATLMCYNLINPLAFENKNSILENEELEAYLKGVKNYPLHLDVVLPVYSWLLAYQNKQFAGIVDMEQEELRSFTKSVSPMWLEVTEEFTAGNLFLRPGDLLKYEDVSEETIRKTIELLRKYITFGENTTISLFHLDIPELQQYDYETLNSFYTDFNR